MRKDENQTKDLSYFSSVEENPSSCSNTKVKHSPHDSLHIRAVTQSNSVTWLINRTTIHDHHQLTLKWHFKASPLRIQPRNFHHYHSTSLLDWGILHLNPLCRPSCAFIKTGEFLTVIESIRADWSCRKSLQALWLHRRDDHQTDRSVEDGSIISFTSATLLCLKLGSFHPAKFSIFSSCHCGVW